MVLQEHKNYVDGNDQIGSMMVKLAVLMGQLLPIGEIVLYVYIFRLLHKANEKAPRLGLSKEVSRIIKMKCICKYFYTQSYFYLQAVQMRRRKNVITLGGQIITFCIETFGGLMIQLQLNLNGFGASTGQRLLTFMSPTIISLTTISTSPELRRFYFNDP